MLCMCVYVCITRLPAFSSICNFDEKAQQVFQTYTIHKLTQLSGITLISSVSSDQVSRSKQKMESTDYKYYTVINITAGKYWRSIILRCYSFY